MLAVLFVLSALPQLRLSSAQIAPGGEEETLEHCKSLRSGGILHKLTHPTNDEVLLDSWNYQNLLPDRIGAVWQQVDNDSNNQVELTTNVSQEFAVGVSGSRQSQLYFLYRILGGNLGS